MTDHQLSKILKSVAQGMISGFEKTSQIVHRGGKGRAREEAVKRFLERRVPRSCDVIHDGEIVDHDGNTSPQCDILITGGDVRPLQAEDGYHLVAPASVRGIVEVKSYLSADEFRKSFRSLVKSKLMNKFISGYWKKLPDGTTAIDLHLPTTLVFAYESASLDLLLEEFSNLADEIPNLSHSIDGIWVLTKGYIKWGLTSYLGVDSGDPYPSNGNVIVTSGSPEADLVAVDCPNGGMLLPLAAELNARLSNSPEGLVPFMHGDWGRIRSARHFLFPEPTGTMRPKN